jgi:hypothetical protein
MRSNLKTARTSVILGVGRQFGPSQAARLLVECELHTIIRDERDGSAANFFAGRNVELLSHFGAQDASEMSRVVAHQSGRVSLYFVGDPAAACHEAVLSSQLRPRASDVMFGSKSTISASRLKRNSKNKLLLRTAS